MQARWGEETPNKGLLFAMGTHSQYPDTWLINGLIQTSEVGQLALDLYIIAVNTPGRLQGLRALPPRELVHNSNRFIVSRARRFVWAHDQSQTAFIEKHMSKQMEPAPLFPKIGHHPIETNDAQLSA